MKRWILGLLALLLTAGLGFGDADFPIETRVPNENPGYCGWCTLEMMCRQQKVEAGFNLVQKRKQDPPFVDAAGQQHHQCCCCDFLIEQKLTKMGIKYRIVGGDRIVDGRNVRDEKRREEARQLIRQTIAAGRGVYFATSSHALLLTGFDEKANLARWVDCNNAYCKAQNGELGIYEASLERFEHLWIGMVCVIDN